MSVPAFLRRIFGGLGGADRSVHELAVLCDALLGEKGEYASTAIACDALAAWQRMDEARRGQFFDVLASHYSPPAEAVAAAAAAYQADPTP